MSLARSTAICSIISGIGYVGTTFFTAQKRPPVLVSIFGPILADALLAWHRGTNFEGLHTAASSLSTIGTLLGAWAIETSLKISTNTAVLTASILLATTAELLATAANRNRAERINHHPVAEAESRARVAPR